jgi:hypothetical protein
VYTIVSTNLTTGETKLTHRNNPLMAQEVYSQVIQAAISQGYQVIDTPGASSPWSAVAVLEGKIYFQIDLI